MDDIDGLNTSLGLATVLQRVEHRLRSLTYERGVFLAPDGNAILEVTASPENQYEIAFSHEEIEQVKAIPGSVFTHNHPRGWQYQENNPLRAGHSFSPEDVLLACRALLSEIRAVTPVYTYVMRPLGATFSEADWALLDTVYGAEYETVNRTLIMETVQGRRTVDEALTELEHQTWERTCAILGFRYERVRNL